MKQALVNNPQSSRQERLGKRFFERDTVSLARSLLGAKLVTCNRGVITSGAIVEVEAYLGFNDPACHAARGRTSRTEVMFKAGGHCYVYLIYGMYHCVNVVSESEGVGCGVLIRAVEPLEGIDVMYRRRGLSKGASTKDLARGPGRLCQALGITKQCLGEHFSSSSRIWLEPHIRHDKEAIAISGRIGVSQGADLPLRFFIKESAWVSR